MTAERLVFLLPLVGALIAVYAGTCVQIRDKIRCDVPLALTAALAPFGRPNGANSNG